MLLLRLSVGVLSHDVDAPAHVALHAAAEDARAALADLRECHRAATSLDRDVDVRASWLFAVAECLVGL